MTSARRSKRFWLAALLTAVAVAAPCTAWYVAGSRAAQREADALRARPLERGTEIAIALSERLVGRLEAMRDSESQRPFYHYQGAFHDPTSSCQCASRTPSPLSAGPRDPFVAAHFQIDPDSQLTLPSLSAETPTVRDPDWYQRQRELEVALAGSVEECVNAVNAQIDPASSAGQWTMLEPELWAILDSNPARPSDASSGEPIPGEQSEDLMLQLLVRDPSLRIESFQWHGIAVGGDSTLVALRRVLSSRGPVVQGFVLDHRAVDAWLRSAEYPAELRPGSGEISPAEALAAVVLDCTQWEIAIDVGDAVDVAEQSARAIEAGFVRSFSLGSLAAVLAGCSVIVLLLRTERMARERARFAASAAHELRTPLAGLRLYGDMLSGELGDPAQVQKYAQRISEEAERLGRVVTNVLGFSRLERGGVELNIQAGDLAMATREIVERLRPTVESAGSSLTVALPDAAPACFDRDALEHILQNLVDNAEKYSRGSEDRRVEIAVRRNGQDGWELSVRDHGPGIAPSLEKRLFEPFERGEARDAPAGLGLGLLLVRSLVRAHGETIAWRNRDDGGAEFTVRFAAS